MQRINNLIDFGNNSSSIVSTIRGEEGLNIDYDTIYSIKMDKMQGLLDDCKNDPSSSAVGKLINLFKNSPNVSFVYIIHRYNSGFITFRKTKKEKQLEKLPESTLTPTEMELVRSTKNWRESLSLSKSKGDVLVAFAWAHDDELRNAEMYPEFLAGDITFGVNRERRELLLLAGIDGRHRIFTAFRCFIPSKQEQAYTWIFKEAIPHLLTNNVLKYNSCMASDNEAALVNAENSSILSNKESFKFSKLRLDCYHAFTQTWLKESINSPTYDSEAKEALDTMYKWILTWFKKIETEVELDLSIEQFHTYFSSKQQFLTDVTIEAITKLLVSLINKKIKLFHLYFKDVITFDFIGDTIVESANNWLLKEGALGVSSKMSICTSGLTQLKAAREKNLKESISSAKSVNSKKTWSKSLTSDYLTNYAEGLACSNFDRKEFYVKRRVSAFKWFVCHSSITSDHINHLIDDKESDVITRFKRVRTVEINSCNFMKCSCCYYNRWLMPCVHMCSVINDNKHYSPELFHIRWWKHFHFLFKRDIENQKNEDSVNNMKSSLYHIRENHFCSETGKYKGIPLEGTSFLTSLDDKYNFETEGNNDVAYDVMLAIVKMQDNKKTVTYGSNDYQQYMPVSKSQPINNNDVGNDLSQDSDSLLFDFNDNEANVLTEKNTIKNMGAGSQVLSQLSEFRDECETNSNIIHNKSNDDKLDVYEELKPMFYSLLKTIKTENQLLETKDTFEKLTFKFGNQLSKKRTSCDDHDDITFLGELNGPRVKESRYKFHYEKNKK